MKPIDDPVFADNVNTDGVRLDEQLWIRTAVAPGTTGSTARPKRTVPRQRKNGCAVCSWSTELPTSLVQPFSVSDLVVGLQGDSEYHFRLVTRNEQGTSVSPDHFIVTNGAEQEPACPNQLDRQQTGSQFLPDCRAYELASTSYSGGADVLSTTVPGKQPLVAYPDASGKLLVLA